MPTLPVFAGEVDIPSGETLRSGAEIDFPPFSFVDEQGKADGFSVELLRAALAAMGRDVTYSTGVWPEVRGWLERAEIDALPIVGRTPEREALFDFTVPYMSLHGAIVVRDNETGINDLADLRGRKVAVMQGDNAHEFLRREDRGIEIHTTPTFEIALRELSEGRYDAVVVQRLVALRLIQKAGLTDLRVIDRPVEGFKQDFCFAVHEGDRETLALLNEGLAIVMADGTYRFLYSKWFAAMQLPSDRPIVVGGDRNFPPYEYLDKNGHPAGYNVDLTRAIALEMGLNIEIRLGRWTERLQALKEGKIDVMQGMFYSPARERKFNFSQPHTVSHYMAVVRKGEGPAPESVEELAGKRIVVEQGDILHDFVVDNGLEDQVVAVSDQEEALRRLSAGKYDCALVSLITANYLIDKHGWSNLVRGKKSILASEYCYAFPEDRKALLAQFSEGLKSLESSGEYRRIYDKWLGVYQEKPTSFLVAVRYSAIVIIPLLLIALLAGIWSWSLRRQVAEKTKALQESLEQFKYIFEAANVGKSITLPTGELNANKALADFLGYEQDELQGKKWQELTPIEDIEEAEKIIAPLLAGEKEAARFETRFMHKNGRYLWADVSVAMRYDAGGKPLYFMTTIVDINARKEAEEALRNSEEYLRAMIACSPVALYTIDPDENVLSWNRSAERIFGWPAEEVIGKPLPIVPVDKRHEFETLHEKILGGESFFGKELTRLKKDGSLVSVSLSVAPVKNNHGETIGILGAAEDISERKRMETALRHERDLNQRYLDTTQTMMVALDAEGRVTMINRSGRELLGYTEDEILGCNWFETCLPQPDGADSVYPVFRRIMAGDLAFAEYFENSVVRRDGTIRLIGWHNAFLEDDNRRIIGTLSSGEDITERKQAEKEYKKLQAQLLQAQKMGSVGRLAGGVAHDYNNMLSVIMGNAELALDTIAPDDPVHSDLQEILAAAGRSADITRQLLAFARKQTIAPEVLDLNETVESMLKMLRRLIGEDIDLAWKPGSGLWAVKIDRSQVDQILVNLCVNARDAICDVGKITIETSNVRFDEEYCADHAGFVPGEYVLLAVSDDGCGIDQEKLDKIFEPFYTTKDIGRGTGLGLSVLYGIVKQNEGFINVYSEPEKGTTFRIYFSRHAAAVERIEKSVPAATPVGSGETVLVVEDEAAILQLAKRILERLGYKVLSASSPQQALTDVHEHQGEVRLLITDVVMPEMNGRDLAEKLQGDYPNLKVLFMSGYTANVIAHRGVLDAGVHFIQKPFSNRDFAVKVREALDK